VSTSTCSPVSAILDHDQADVGQVQLGRVDDAHDHHLVPVGEQRQGPVPVAGRR
jgi:hypothetical protein